MSIQSKLKEMRERCEAADRLVCDLASGKKKWNMCVPPQEDDTDMALIKPVREDMPALISALEVCLEALSKIAFCEIMVNDIKYKTFNDAFINMADSVSKKALADIEKELG